MTDFTRNNEIVVCDALDYLSGFTSGSVDAVITDPPYSSGGFSESAKRQAKGQGLRSETLKDTGWFINDNMGTAGMVWLMRALACEASRILVDGGSLLCFCDWRMLVSLAPAMESSGLRYQNLVVWDKGNTGLGNGFRPCHELVMHFVKGVGKFYAFNGSNVIRSNRVSSTAREHQTQKPVALLSDLIKIVTPPNGLVVDPFTGSGSALLAAQLLGRRYAGCDLSPEYVAIANRRLNEPYTPDLFPEAAPVEPEATQGDLFAAWDSA